MKAFITILMINVGMIFALGILHLIDAISFTKADFILYIMTNIGMICGYYFGVRDTKQV
jgi:hypothetical protein